MSDKKTRQRGLGRGLSALMADVTESHSATEPTSSQPDRVIPIENVVPNPGQPRRSFDKSGLDDLAMSIREKGIIQPLIVRPDRQTEGNYEIVAGERRWRAAQIARLHDIPVLIRDYDDSEMLEIAIIENVQRADLNPVEEAVGYRQLMEKFGHTQEKLATALGKSRSHIANTLRLLSLPEDVLTFLRDGTLSAGHARALIPAEDPVSLAREVIRKQLSVRETERMVKANAGKSAAATGHKGSRTKSEKDADTRALEGELSANLGMKVAINHQSGRESGQLVISYESFEQLDDLCRVLSAGKSSMS